MTAVEASRTTGHSSLRQIVHALDEIAAGEGGEAAEEDDLPGTPVTADEAASLPAAESETPLEPPPPNAESEAGSGIERS